VEKGGVYMDCAILRVLNEWGLCRGPGEFRAGRRSRKKPLRGKKGKLQRSWRLLRQKGLSPAAVGERALRGREFASNMRCMCGIAELGGPEEGSGQKRAF